MTSFFQPDSHDPTIQECGHGRFDVYCNSILPADHRWNSWYQHVSLIVGAVAIGTPFLIWLCLVIKRRGSVLNPRKLFSRPGQRRPSDAQYSKLTVAPLAIESTRSFRYYPDTDSLSDQDQDHERYDFVILPLSFNTVGEESGGDGVQQSARLTMSNNPAKTRLACVDLDSLGSGALEDGRLARTTEMLAATCFQSNLAGLALRCTASVDASQVEKLMQKLFVKQISVLLLCHHDSEHLNSISLKHAAGIVVENACILPNGQRRDYFQAQGLRAIMARCLKERETKPEFFVGFLDLWTHRPHPSVVRRAVKLAEHFGAVVEHGPANPGMGPEGFSVAAERTLSAFEYLKRADMTEMQKMWTSEMLQVWIDNEQPDGAEVASLPLDRLDSVIAGASQLLRHQELHPALAQMQREVPTYLDPPDYLGLAPARKNFWTMSCDNNTISSLGCFSICAEPSPDDYAAVVETQEHLKELQMLHVVKGVEALKLIETLKTVAWQQDCGYLVQELIDGLESHQICIYKGMDTGFRVPDGDGHFWGVSSTRLDQEKFALDIYLSQKAPNDATTVLHTWLAHNSVPREQRFIFEGRLEEMCGLSANGRLPLSVKAAIERATHAEILQLLQQLRVTHMAHPLREPMVEFCKHILLSKTTTDNRRRVLGRKLLDGSLTMREALRTRLEDMVRHGATQIPSLDNLLELHGRVEKAVREALFLGEREPLNALSEALSVPFDYEEMAMPQSEKQAPKSIDINADMFALILFSVFRAAAFEEVYIEATDRCPLFLQPDQAAVFSELWVMGSQCEGYFGILPRDLGEIIYDRYQVFLQNRPPVPADRRGNEIMSMYANSEVPEDTDKNQKMKNLSPAAATMHERLGRWRKRFSEFGAMSIFCLPAIIDVVLLTFLGRGMFMTAFMEQDELRAAVYALLIALLLSSGLVGWVGSTGNYYLANYAYDNMIHFHVQRLSSGFVLTFVIGIAGFIAFAVRQTVPVAFIFVAFLIGITTYLNLLGIMATMHQRNSPLTSGRSVVWRTMPLLLLSPLISTFVNAHDIAVYLPVIYFFLFVLLYQYRRLCHEWSGWMRNIPDFTEKMVLEWYTASNKSRSEGGEVQNQSKASQEALVAAISSYKRRTREAVSSGLMDDKFVQRVANGMPYIDWLFKKTNPGQNLPPAFTSGWFTQLGDAKKQQQQLARGLQEHNILMLFRSARYDIGQNMGLFLVALMDRWVSVVMSARQPNHSMYINSRARYGICFCILYFSFGVMVLDVVLQKYWGLRFTSSKEPLADYHHSRVVAAEWEAMRRRKMLQALTELLVKIAVVFGVATLLVWVFVESSETFALYYFYVFGYTCVIIFQFNRCFTTNIRGHVITIFASACAGFIAGCVLHALPSTAGWIYADVFAQNIAALLAAVGTFMWAWSELATPTATAPLEAAPSRERGIWAQRKLRADDESESKIALVKARRIDGIMMKHDDGSYAAEMVTSLLRKSMEKPSTVAQETAWSTRLIETVVAMWEARRIRAVAVNYEKFFKAGMGDICSISQLDGDVITVKVGLFGETELRSPAWHPLLATITVESLLYHVARIDFMQTHSQAVKAEHFLSDTTALSKRLEMELALFDANSLRSILRKTNSELMRHLCWDVHVDSSWESMPLSAREAIICRITGHQVPVSGELVRWISDEGLDLQSIEFNLRLCLDIFQNCEERYMSTVYYSSSNQDRPEVTELAAQLRPVKLADLRPPSSFFSHMRCLLRMCTAVPLTMFKWLLVISGGGANVERELWYCLRKVPLNGFILEAILFVWQTCRAIKDVWVYALLVYHRSDLVHITRLAQKGERRKMKRNAIIVDLPRKTITAFASKGDDEGHMKLEAFDGRLPSPPAGKAPLFTSNYDDKLRLISRTDDKGITSTYKYHAQARGRPRWPQCKKIFGKNYNTIGFYDTHGRIKHGVLALDESSTKVNFCYHYKATPKSSASILRADFTPINTGSTEKLSIYWGMPPSNSESDECDWIPSEKVCRIVRSINGRTYMTQIEYHHRRDPMSTTVVQDDSSMKTAVAEAPHVSFEEESLFTRPHNLSFAADDVLIHHSLVQVENMRHYANQTISALARWSPLAVWGRRAYRSVPTWRIRTELWSRWLNGTLDAVTVCWIDELILREEPLLRKYWRARERGRLDEAKAALDDGIDQIVPAIELETDISELCLLPIRTADLYAMGLGKDATQVTNRPQDCFKDTKDRISVIFNDIGCWPEAPGGVSNCRRDLVDGHSTIRNHVLAECANDFGIPRFQIERNVQSLKLLPLWGLDGKTAYHGLIDNKLQSQVDDKIGNTDLQRDIVGVFVPLLKDFVKGARTKSYSRADLIKYTNVMLSMSKYYEHKDYNETWNSKAVQDAWADSWLIPYNDSNISDPSQNFALERPTMMDFRDALGIYLAYFFIFSVSIPEDCPRVFQSTHHGISSLFGMILKYRRGTTFGIWDHAILWRESCLNISPAQCELSIPVQSMLLAGMRLASRLAYFHADIVVPCTSLFNPMWETEIGTDQGKLCNKNLFGRKIDPIVNGISNMDSFKPVDKVRTDKPTVVMLSNVQFIKGIKTAILAADLIVNRYGFTEYKLMIYGAKDRQPSYALEMAKLIVKCNLSENVVLAGFGKPKEVLQDAWLFVNSSISEGLPLAIGEAALAGVPIVATEVGATALVVTDPNDQDKRYGGVVAPNDPVALARSQLSLLCMVGPWAKFTEDGGKDGGGPLPEDITPQDKDRLLQRMYEKSPDRRRLGLLSREVVLHSFHGRRYLREHEQMFWIQWHMAKMRAQAGVAASARTAARFGALPPLRYSEAQVDVADDEDDEEWLVDDGFHTGDDDSDTAAESEAERVKLVESPDSAGEHSDSVDSEAQTVRPVTMDAKSKLASMLFRPSLVQVKSLHPAAGNHHHQSLPARRTAVAN